jgi:hypothetical protein
MRSGKYYVFGPRLLGVFTPPYHKTKTRWIRSENREQKFIGASRQIHLTGVFHLILDYLA